MHFLQGNFGGTFIFILSYIYIIYIYVIYIYISYIYIYHTYIYIYITYIYISYISYIKTHVDLATSLWLRQGDPFFHCPKVKDPQQEVLQHKAWCRWGPLGMATWEP